jgi:CHAD domain-containing protein
VVGSLRPGQWGYAKGMTAVDTARRPATGSARHAEAPHATPVRPDSARVRRGAGGRALVAYLTTQRDAMRAAEPGVRYGDADAVHDMRVATRRLRSTLRSFRSVLRPWQPLRDELKWFATALGGVRDGDVMGQRLAEAVAAQPPELVIGPVAARLAQRVASESAQARERLIEAMDSPRYAGLLAGLDDLVVAGPTRRVGKGRLRRAARRALLRADRRLDAGRKTRDHAGDDAGRTTGDHTVHITGDHAGPSRDERLHEARKAYKRARYAVEVLVPVGGRPAARLRKRLKYLQDVLGAHQDAVITTIRLREHGLRAFAAGENAFTYGLLGGRQQEGAALSRARLPRARRRVAAAKVRGWLGG